MGKRNLFYLLFGATTGGGGGGTDTSDATATAADIRLGKTAYIASGKVTGTIPDYDGTTEPTSGKSLFAQLTDGSITEVTVSDLKEVAKIKDGAFAQCSSLKSIILPDGLEFIGDEAFSGCAALTSITIPDSVTSIGFHVFERCGTSTMSGTTITILAATPPTAQSGICLDAKINSIIVPKGSGDAYKSATNWSALADYIEEAAE